MSILLEVMVPNIGDFKDVEVIEVLVKPGDRIDKEQSLITLESDKATMEIPSSHAGIVKELKIRVGDKVSHGSSILLLETGRVGTPTKAAMRNRRESNSMWERISGWGSSWITSSVKRNILTVACFVVGVYFLAESYVPPDRLSYTLGAHFTPSTASIGVGFIVCGFLFWRRGNKDK